MRQDARHSGVQIASGLFLKKKNCIEIWLLCNVVLVSTVLQRESVTRVSPLLWISFPFRSAQIIE